MPCTAPVRGKTDAKYPWKPSIQNDPCGVPDVYAGGLCKLHWQMANGQVAGPDPATVFLFHADTLVDSSSYAHPLTALGDAKIDSTQFKFGGSSLLLDGVGDYLTSPDSPDFDLGGGDFTIDFWYRPAVVAVCIPVAQYIGGSKGWLIQITTTTIYWYYSVDGTTQLSKVVGSFPQVAGTWYHVAVVRSGNALMGFVNGVSAGASADVTGLTFWNSTASLSIGADGLGGQPVNGNLDEVRISKGIARWTANFTPPSTPY